MKKFAICVVIGAALAVAPSVALSGVEGTHHDMRHMTGDQEKSVCAFCHLPHNAKSDKGLFARESSAGAELGRVGAFCYSCHDGTVTPYALIEAPNGDVGLKVLTESHGYITSEIGVKSAHLESVANVAASGLIQNDPTTGLPPSSFDCLACHDIHNAGYPPFLRAPMKDLCRKCHSGTDLNGKGRWSKVEDAGSLNGPHPIGMPVAASGFDNKRDMPAETSFHKPLEVFRKPLLSRDEVLSPSNHWTLGGHLFEKEEAVDCSTCHSAHMPVKSLLVAAGEHEKEKALCAGCHGDGKNPANPGTTVGYHPVFEESAPPYIHEHASHPHLPDLPTSGFMELFVDLPKQYPIETDGTLTCRSCHLAHGGQPGTKGLRVGRGNWLANVICNDCHQMGSEVDREDMHHPIGARDYTEFGFEKLTSWAWGPDQPGDLSDGLQCVDCHTDWAISAHNW